VEAPNYKRRELRGYKFQGMRKHASIRSSYPERPRRPIANRARSQKLRRRFEIGTRYYTQNAKLRLKRFRQGSRLAVAMTGLLLLVLGIPDSSGQGNLPTSPPKTVDPSAAVNEATGTLRELLRSFYSLLPKIAIALGILVFAIFLARALKLILIRTLGSWNRAAAIGAITQVVLILVALGTALSVIAGDARALVGSVGLAGLALSWALQTPIESFTGWLLNSFRSYYRVGDRIEVGEVFGDVYKIDILTTTVWEAGGESKTVHGAQPTGALITFPNSEVLKANIINYTQDFPYVWDEVIQGVANESDLAYTVSVLKKVAKRVLGDAMRVPAQEYLQKIAEKNLCYDVATEPTVFVSVTDAWTNLTIRYLVPARERRRWSSELLIEISKELSRLEHKGQIIPSLPRMQIELLRIQKNDNNKEAA
jgi:small conductance mechanosensitive channel